MDNRTQPNEALGLGRLQHGRDPDSANGAAIYATLALFITNLVAYLDRSVLALFVEPVKRALGLSDGQIGLLLGAAFVLTFTVAGLVMGRLVDRMNRRNLLVIAVAVWTIGTIATGLAQSVSGMFLARMTVGVGEAALFPAAVSLFADFFSPSKRGRPYGIFTTGLYVGGGAALIVIGAMLPLFARWSEQAAAMGDAFEQWRLVMFAMVVPGVACILVLLFMREPVRRTWGTSPVDALPVPTAAGGFETWWKLRSVLLPHHLTIAIVTLGLYGLSAWMPTLLIREHGYTPRDAGVLYGLIVAVTGIVGAVVGGVAADRASRSGGVVGRWRVVLCCILAGWVGYAIIGLATTAPVILLGSVFVSAPLGAAVVAGIMAMSDLSPDHARGQVTGIYFAFAGVIGTAGGPALVGYLSDRLAKAGTQLSGIIGIVGIGSIVLGVLLGLVTLRNIRLTHAPS